MVLKKNLEYWQLSLQNPEPVVDDYYIFDEIIVEDEKFIRKVERLRELIITYCVMREKDKKTSAQIVDEIYEIITSSALIQYSEFVAFWKVMDMSFSVFLKSRNRKAILTELLEKYCERRRKLYDKLGYSNIVIQALYDSGAARKKGTSGILKILDIANKLLGLDKHLNTITEIVRHKRGYFLPDKNDKELFKSFCEKFKVAYRFGKLHQRKNPDVVLKVGKHFFIIEAKHIKEFGGAQDKQIVEAIDFINYSENSRYIHYTLVLDGVYFNNFISASSGFESKICKQKNDVETTLKNNLTNFFVNTAGFKAILKDISKTI